MFLNQQATGWHKTGKGSKSNWYCKPCADQWQWGPTPEDLSRRQNHLQVTSTDSLLVDRALNYLKVVVSMRPGARHRRLLLVRRLQGVGPDAVHAVQHGRSTASATSPSILILLCASPLLHH